MVIRSVPLALFMFMASLLSITSVSGDSDAGGLLGSSNLMLNMIRVWGPELLKQMPKRRDTRSATKKATGTDFTLHDSLREMQPELLQGHMNSISPALEIFKEAPEIVLPMLVRYAQSIGSHSDCIKRTICEANQRIVERFGLVGHVLGTIGSEFVISAMTGSSGHLYNDATEGGKAGREGYDCYKEFPRCGDHPNKLYD